MVAEAQEDGEDSLAARERADADDAEVSFSIFESQNNSNTMILEQQRSLDIRH